MPLAFVLDENLRGLLWQVIRRHNARSGFPVDVVRVGDGPELPMGSPDAFLLQWAAEAGRIVVSRDARTLPTQLAEHLAAGRSSPGVFLVREAPLARIVEFLVCAAHVSDAAEWQDRITFVP